MESGTLWLFLVEAVQFGGLGLFYHLVSNRLDLLSQRVDSVHREIQAVSPLVATERVGALAEEMAKVWREIAALESADLAFREELRDLERASSEATSLLGGKVDRLREQLLAEIRLLKTPPRAKPGDVQGG